VSSPVVRTALIATAVLPAVVLGSTQSLDHIDQQRAAARGLRIVRRRSGGAAVLVGEDQCLWVDLVVPVGDPLWSDDVGQAVWWVGDLWAEALRAIGLGSGQVWRQAVHRTEWSSRVCFGGIGPGEVTVDGRKVVGISQRRTRYGALFQCAALIRWDPYDLVDILALSPAERERARSALDPMALGVGGRLSGPLEAAVVAALG
jgi:lipoate-protein ligase A